MPVRAKAVSLHSQYVKSILKFPFSKIVNTFLSDKTPLYIYRCKHAFPHRFPKTPSVFDGAGGAARRGGVRIYFAARFALIAEATRLTGGRPISRLTSLVAATNFGMSTPVAMPMPSSM